MTVTIQRLADKKMEASKCIPMTQHRGESEPEKILQVQKNKAAELRRLMQTTTYIWKKVAKPKWNCQWRSMHAMSLLLPFGNYCYSHARPVSHLIQAGQQTNFTAADAILLHTLYLKQYCTHMPAPPRHVVSSCSTFPPMSCLAV